MQQIPLPHPIKGKPMPRYYIAYATANDRFDYRLDLTHLRNMSRHNPGVGPVRVFISISLVRPYSEVDKKFVEKLFKDIDSEDIEIASIEFKSNIGRDFSSFANSLRNIAKEASAEDFILFLNRSGYGPSRDNWYHSYIEQLEKFQPAGICGTTINFLDHPDLKRGICAHVQTYCFLSRLSAMRALVEKFPGENAVERIDVIKDGEIGLSQTLIKNGLSLTCLEWPDHLISDTSKSLDGLPLQDIKSEVSDHPFKYRNNNYKIERPNTYDLIQVALTRFLSRIKIKKW